MEEKPRGTCEPGGTATNADGATVLADKLECARLLCGVARRKENDVADARNLLARIVVTILAPIVIALVFILLSSLLKEPSRQNFNAVFVAGAGAAYLSGGFGGWEFVFTGLVTYCAYRGLRSYSFIGVAWLLHTGWDALHHLYGNPIVPFVPESSLGCAISDPVIALWFFAGAPSVYAACSVERRTARRDMTARRGPLHLHFRSPGLAAHPETTRGLLS